MATSPHRCSASVPRPLARAPPTLASSKRRHCYDAHGLKNGGVVGDDCISCLPGLSTYGVSFVHGRMLYLLCSLAFSRYVDLASFADYIPSHVQRKNSSIQCQEAWLWRSRDSRLEQGHGATLLAHTDTCDLSSLDISTQQHPLRQADLKFDHQPIFYELTRMYVYVLAKSC